MKRIIPSICLILLSFNSFSADPCSQATHAAQIKYLDHSLFDNMNTHFKIRLDMGFNSISEYEEKQSLLNFYQEFCTIPFSIRNYAQAKGLSFYLTAGPITAHRHFAQQVKNNKRPRNHHGSVTWNDLPGSYVPQTKEVVVNILSLDQGHGSKSLVLHEYAHGLDYVFNGSRIYKDKLSDEPSFKRLFNTTPWHKVYQEGRYIDVSALPAEYLHGSAAAKEEWRNWARNVNYNTQKATDELVRYHKAYREEHFAEIFSRYYANQSSQGKLVSQMPSVIKYFSQLESRSHKGASSDVNPGSSFFGRLKNKATNLLN